MYRAIARSAALGVTVALLAACAAPGTRPGSQAPPPGLPLSPAPTTAAALACPAPGVLVREGAGDAAMGLRVQVIELVNCGSQPYTVNGYPVVHVLDDGHTTLDVTVQQGTKSILGPGQLDATPQPVTLQHGQSATASLAWRNLVTDATVVATSGTYLVVAPTPGQPAQTLTLKHHIDLGNTDTLGISPWVAS